MLNEKEIKLGTSFVIRDKQEYDGLMQVDYLEYSMVPLSAAVTKRLLVEEVE